MKFTGTDNYVATQDLMLAIVMAAKLFCCNICWHNCHFKMTPYFSFLVQNALSNLRRDYLDFGDNSLSNSWPSDNLSFDNLSFDNLSSDNLSSDNLPSN